VDLVFCGVFVGTFDLVEFFDESKTVFEFAVLKKADWLRSLLSFPADCDESVSLRLLCDVCLTVLEKKDELTLFSFELTRISADFVLGIVVAVPEEKYFDIPAQAPDVFLEERS